MDGSLLEILDFSGEGYQPLVDFSCWRVAILRYMDQLQANRIESMERHTGTDEVFVLMHGQGILLIGGNEIQVNEIHPQVMEPEKVYNVKRNTWHSIILSQNASVLIVENRDTDKHNTNFITLSIEQRNNILKISGKGV